MCTISRSRGFGAPRWASVRVRSVSRTAGAQEVPADGELAVSARSRRSAPRLGRRDACRMPISRRALPAKGCTSPSAASLDGCSQRADPFLPGTRRLQYRTGCLGREALRGPFAGRLLVRLHAAGTTALRSIYASLPFGMRGPGRDERRGSAVPCLAKACSKMSMFSLWCKDTILDLLCQVFYC